MARKEFTQKTKGQALKRCMDEQGVPHCEGCGRPLIKGLKYEFHHVTACWKGGDNSLDNCKVLCIGGKTSCHAIESADDKARTTKADNVKKFHNNMKTKGPPIRSPGFPVSEKTLKRQAANKLPVPRPRNIYA